MFSYFFIDRPIFATVLSIVIVILGGVALSGLPIAQYPEVAPPTISVTASYPGANAKVVAETVAAPIEQEVNGVERMLYMSSKCTNDGQMTLDITFELGTDINQAQVLVQNRVAIAEARLPDEVKRQGVTTKKKSPSILLCVNLISPDQRYDQLYLSNYATIQIKDALSRLTGVGDVQFLGARDYSMRVWLDPNKLASRSMTATDVVAALKEQNVQVAAGRVGQPPVPTGQDFQYTINTLGRLLEPEEFADIVIKTGQKGEITRLKDVARTELGAKNYETGSDLDGKPCITLAVFQLPGSNALATAKGIKSEMAKLKERFPEGVDYAIVYDTTVFIDESVRAVMHTLIEAFLLVFIVVLVFLQTWRATVIPMIAVPVSLIGTFGVMAMLGFSLNNLSLFGLVLAIGIVVDDAIVVVENVERWLAEGLSAKEAARKAMTEVTGPVVGIALVLCAVFVPTAMMAGISGEFYRQFALTIAASTVISAFNSLTLSPALAAVMLKPHHAKKDPLEWLMGLTLGWFFKGFNWTFDRTISGYGGAVRLLLRTSVIVLAVYGGLMYLTYVGFTTVPIGFIPEQDKGYLVVNAQLPDGASLERTEEVVARIGKIVRDTEGVAHTIGIPGYSVLTSNNLSNMGGMFVILAPFEERKGDAALGARNIAARLRAEFAKIQEAQIVAFGAPPIDGLGNTGGFKLQIQDRQDSGLPNLQGTVERLATSGNAQPGLVGLFTSFSANQPQLFIDIDRTKAKSQGIPLDNLFQTLQVYLGSAYVNDFTRFGRNWQVNVQADSAFRVAVEDIGKLKVRNAAGEMVPLATLISLRDVSGPAIVNHYQMYNSAEISGNTAPGFSSGQAISAIEQLAEAELPRSFGYEWTELTLQQIKAGQDVMTKLAFPLGVVFVFLVLCAQYESWSLPLSIIMIVPMCLLAAIAGVWLMGMDNNIFTQIGLLVLVGLAAKNAILIVEFAKEQRKQGMSRVEAAVSASKLRLRPILMTSLAFILGVVPLVLAKGAGAEMRVALGVAVFSGMLGVTLFGIFFTPVFYSVIVWLAEIRRSKEAQHSTAVPGATAVASATAAPTATAAAGDGHAAPRPAPTHAGH